MKANSLFIEITRICNKKCPYCYNNMTVNKKNINGLMNDKLFKNIIDQASRLNIHNITLSGGEPTTHPKFLNFVSNISERKMYCRINTNTFDMEKLINAVYIYKKKEKDLQIQLTIDGYKTTHEKFRGPSDYINILENTRKLRAIGFRGIINIRYNLHSGSLDEIQNVCKDFYLLADHIFLSPIFGGNVEAIPTKTYLNINQLVQKINGMQNDKRLSLFIPPLSCTLSHATEDTAFSPLLDSSGNVYLCELSLGNSDFLLGNVAEKQLVDILSINSIMQVIDRLKKRVCLQPCILKKLCQGGCKGIRDIAEFGDGYCELRKSIFLADIKRNKYQCWG